MSSGSRELMQMATGQIIPSRADRQLAKAARGIRDEVRIAGYEAEGAFALAEKIMDGLVTLDDIRKQLAGDDPVKQMLLADVMATAARQALGIQRQLYTSW